MSSRPPPHTIRIGPDRRGTPCLDVPGAPAVRMPGLVSGSRGTAVRVGVDVRPAEGGYPAPEPRKPRPA